MDATFNIVDSHRQQELMMLNKAQPDVRIISPKAQSDGCECFNIKFHLKVIQKTETII